MHINEIIGRTIGGVARNDSGEIIFLDTEGKPIVALDLWGGSIGVNGELFDLSDLPRLPEPAGA